MGSKTSNDLFKKPTVLLFGEENELNKKVVRRIENNLCRVLTKKRKGFFLSTDKIIGRCDYILVNRALLKNIKTLKGFINFKKETKEVVKYSEKYSSKTLFVLPYVTDNKYNHKAGSFVEDLIKRKNIKGKILYLGEVINKNNPEEKDSYFSNIIFDLIRNKSKTLKVNNTYYPLNLEKASDEIVRSLFSFSTLKNKEAVISKPVSSEELTTLIRKYKGKAGFEFVKRKKKSKYPEVNYVREVSTNIENLIRNIFSKKKGNIFLNKTTKQNKKRNKIIFWTTALFVFLLSPYIFLLLSVISIQFAKNMFYKGNLDFCKKSLIVGKTVSNVATFQLSVIPIPLSEISFIKESKATAGALTGVSRMGIEVTDIINNLLNLKGKINGEKIYDIKNIVDNIYYETQQLSEEIGFFQTEAMESRLVSDYLFRKNIDQFTLTEIRRKLYMSGNLIRDIPWLLGESETKTYLVLLQNNFKTRPTGGFIESYALLSFNRGLLTKTIVRDTSEIDSNIKGQIKPPPQIEKYLSKDNWFLEDINWSPDFAESSIHAKKLIERELDLKIDGVIGINLETLGIILKELDPVIYKEEGKVVIGNDFEAVVMDYISSPKENKKEFIRLMEGIIKSALDDNKRDAAVLVEIMNELERKNVQIYLDNTKLQSAISSLNWAGNILGYGLEKDCSFDLLGVVEAELGKNYVSRNTEKSYVLDVEIGKKEIIKKLKIGIANNSPDFFDPEEKIYKSYLRLVASTGSIFMPIEKITPDGKFLIEPQTDEFEDRTESGIYLELYPGEQAEILFTWKNMYKYQPIEKGSHCLHWFKQPGTKNSNVLIRYNPGKDIQMKAQPNFSLTGPEMFGYNTELSRDFNSRVHWDTY